MTAPGSGDAQRVAALHALGVLDTPAEARFDRYTRLAAKILGTPIALISLVDEQRQWFKSRVGIEASETPRSMAFCSHAVASGQMLVVEDTLEDSRFVHNPLVTGDPNIRFYAGQPVLSDGQAIGTLCVIDRTPRQPTEDDRQCLSDLADLVQVELNHAKVNAARLAAEEALHTLNRELEMRVAQRTAQLRDKVHELEVEVARRRAAEVSLSEALAWNRTIVESSYSAVIGMDSAGRIVEWNAAAERIFGWPAADAMGQDWTQLIVPAGRRLEHSAMVRQLMGGTSAADAMPALTGRKVELPALTASGRLLSVEMTVSSHEWKGERYCGAFLTDISERVRTQQQLEEKQELLDAVLESIDIAVVACDAVGNLTLFNHAARAMHGLDPKQIAPADWTNYYSLYRADGQTPMRMDEVPLVEALQGSVIKDRAMAVAPAGRPMHMLLASGRPLRSAAGRPLGAVVAMKDITEINASRQQLAANERRLRTITDNVPVLIAFLDHERRYRFANAMHRTWFGIDPSAMLGRTVDEAFGTRHHDALAGALDSAWQGATAHCEHEIEHAGKVRVVCSTFLPHWRNGMVAGVYLLSTDATASRQQERNLEALANTDALTHLPNRRKFEQVLEASASRSRQSDGGCSLLYLDIDYFKQINDTHGHAVGDQVLVEFAARLRGAVRSTDTVARLGGDEFTILLGDVRNTSDVTRVAGKILDAVRAPFVLDGLTLSVTTTIGASLCEAGAAGPGPLMETADRALYAAKEAGRNTFVIFGPDTDRLAFAIR